MLTTDRIIRQYEQIEALVNKGTITEAITQLQQFSIQAECPLYLSDLQSIQTIYQLQLGYFCRGTQDPDRIEIWDNMRRKLYETNDGIRHHALLATEQSYYYLSSKGLSKEPVAIESAIIATEQSYQRRLLAELSEPAPYIAASFLAAETELEQSQIRLFDSLLTAESLSEYDQHRVSQAINSGHLPTTALALIPAALLLSLLYRWDISKIEALISLTISTHTVVRNRALVGLILIGLYYRKRLECYPGILSKWRMITEMDTTIGQRLLTITKQLIDSCQTDRITQRLQQDIIPSMIRFNDSVGQKLRLEDLEVDDLSAPKWANFLHVDETDPKVQEFQELQNQGADIYMVSFQHLKSFSFFNELSNWFLPLTGSHSALTSLHQQAGSEEKMVAMMERFDILCYSDRYSFLLSINAIPALYRQQTLEQLGQSDQMLREMSQADSIYPTEKIDSKESRNYIMDLFRFFKLNHHKGSIGLALNQLDQLSALSILLPIWEDSDTMVDLGEFCLSKGEYRLAWEIFQRIIAIDSSKSDYWQRAAFCLEKLEEYQQALSYYLKADLIQPYQLWTLRRITHLYSRLGQHDKALETLFRIQEFSSNVSTLLQIASIEIQQKRYSDALRYLIQAEFADEGNVKVVRLSAWAHLHLRDFARAKSYYKRVIQINATAEDCLNAAHACFLQQDIVEAISYYHQSMLLSSKGQLLEQLTQDQSDVGELGANQMEYAMILDYFRSL